MAYTNLEAKKAYFRAYYLRNKDKIKARSIERNKLHREERNARYREKYAKKYNEAKKVKMYGEGARHLLTVAVCEICGGEGKAIDHNHSTNKVRGKLCHSCNMALGLFKDNARLLRTAADYLESKAA